MKAGLFFILLIGATSAQLGVPSLKDLDLSNSAGVQLLAKVFGLDTVLNKASSLFVEKFKDGDFLRGQSVTDTIKNFIANAKQILTQPAKEWQQGLDIELLGLSAQQFANLLKLRGPTTTEESSSTSPSPTTNTSSTVPSSVDWRTKGAVTEVKNQGQCGSCWSFASVAALEGRIGVKTGKAPVLSEQNLIDCAKNVDGKGCCAGCDGGWVTDGYKYVELNNGIDSNASYPYEAKSNDQCKYDPTGSSGNAVGFEYVAQDEESLKRAVAEGPVAAAIDASGMQTYKAGVLKCYSDKPLDHGVVIVGYGTDKLLGDYWIVKNSWGSSWGEKGFFRLTRNPKYACGIYKKANYPLV